MIDSLFDEIVIEQLDEIAGRDRSNSGILALNLQQIVGVTNDLWTSSFPKTDPGRGRYQRLDGVRNRYCANQYLPAQSFDNWTSLEPIALCFRGYE
jgi:hypothetical protein